LGTTPTWSLYSLRRARINGCLQQINVQYISFSFYPMLLGRVWLLAALDRHRDMSF
jgi:predicted acyltransferase